MIDTSVWVEHLRGTDTPLTRAFRTLLATRLTEVATTEPIVMEILAGAPDDRALRQLEALTTGLPLLPVDGLRDYHDAAAIYRAARRGGETVRELIDCLIAAVVIRHDATLVHNDRDFDVIARVARLRTMTLPATPRRRPVPR